MHKSGTTFLLLILLYLQGLSQSSAKEIVGIVKDSATGEILENASLSLLKLPEWMVVMKKSSQKTGFLFRQNAGNYALITSYVGFRNDTIRFRVTRNDTLLQLPPILLQRAGQELMEVIVKTVIPPFTIKSDTLIYNAGSFKTMPNATVEDLLKRLPGVRVEKDGTVTVQGKRVERIYIDGKEFYLNDPKMATQHLPSAIIDKVEVFDDKTHSIAGKGLADLDANKAINLKLKPEAKQRPFGKAYVSYGDQDRYAAGMQVNSFGRKAYFTGVLKSNNTAGLFNENSLTSTGPTPPGDNRADQLSLNYRNQGKRLLFNSSLVVDKSKVVNETFSNRENFLYDSSLRTDQYSWSDNKNTALNANISLDYKIDSNTTLQLNTYITATESKGINSSRLSTKVLKENKDYLVNSSFFDNRNDAKAFFAYYELSFHKYFAKEGRFLAFRYKQDYSHVKNDLDLYSLTTFLHNDSLLRDQVTRERASGKIYDLKISYSEPVSKYATVSFRYHLYQTPTKSERFTHDFNPVSGNHDIPNKIASNSFESKILQHEWSVAHNYARKKMQYQLGFTLQRTQQQNKNLTENVPDLNDRQTNIFPRARFNFNLSRLGSLAIEYNGSSRQPTVRQLQPIPDYTNPLLIQLGNPNLRQQFTHTILLNLNLTQPTSLSSVIIGAEYRNIVHQIVNSTTINAQGMQELKFVNVSGNQVLNSNLTYGFMLGKKQRGNGQLVTIFGYGRETSLLNGAENIRQYFSLAQTASLNYNVKDKLFAELSAGSELGNVSYSLSKDMSAAYFNHYYTANLSYLLPAAFSVSSAFNLQVTGKQGSLPGNTRSMLNAAASKRFLPKQAGELRFSIFDLLNQNTNFNRTIGENFIEVSGGPVLKRFFQISLIYNLNPPGL